MVLTSAKSPALFQSGVTGLFAHQHVSNAQRDLVTSILASVGECFWVDNEKLIDAITAISGSGPAYFFLLMQSMTQAAIALGLMKKLQTP